MMMMIKMMGVGAYDDDDDDDQDEEVAELHSWLSPDRLTSIPAAAANHKEFNRNFQWQVHTDTDDDNGASIAKPHLLTCPMLLILVGQLFNDLNRSWDLAIGAFQLTGFDFIQILVQRACLGELHMGDHRTLHIINGLYFLTEFVWMHFKWPTPGSYISSIGCITWPRWPTSLHSDYCEGHQCWSLISPSTSSSGFWVLQRCIFFNLLGTAWCPSSK